MRLSRFDSEGGGYKKYLSASVGLALYLSESRTIDFVFALSF